MKGADEMFENTYIAPLNAVKKEAGTGSYRGMRWRIEKNAEGELLAIIFPEPKAFAYTGHRKRIQNISVFRERT